MITPSYGLTATERVLPRLALDWTTGLAQPGVDVVRAGVATFVGSNGLVQSANINTQRVDYSSGTAGLLVEESRANICIRSETFNLWNTTGSVGVTANTTVAPDGNQTADTITRVAGQGDSVLLAQTFTGNGAKAISIWVKKGTSPSSLIVLFDATASLYRLWCDITWSGNAPVLAFTNGSLLKSTEYANNFYRLEFATESVTAANINRIQVFPGRAGSANGNTIICWGAQAENGAFATSYIPTEATAVTRNADVATMTGTNFSSWYNATEGGAVVQVLPSTIIGTRPAVQFDDNTANESITLRGVAADPQLFVVDGGVTQATLDAGTIAANTLYKLGGAWKDASYAVAINGAAAVTQASGTFPTATQARLGSDGTNYLNGHLQSLRFWPQRLTNAEVQAFSK